MQLFDVRVKALKHISKWKQCGFGFILLTEGVTAGVELPKFKTFSSSHSY